MDRSTILPSAFTKISQSKVTSNTDAVKVCRPRNEIELKYHHSLRCQNLQNFTPVSSNIDMRSFVSLNITILLSIYPKLLHINFSKGHTTAIKLAKFKELDNSPYS